MTIFREEATSALAGFPVGILAKLEYGNVDYSETRKTRVSREKPLEQGENKHKTRTTYGTGPELNFGHIVGGTQSHTVTKKLYGSHCWFQQMLNLLALCFGNIFSFFLL